MPAVASRVLDYSVLARDLMIRGRRNLERFTAQRVAAGLVRLYESLANGGS